MSVKILPLAFCRWKWRCVDLLTPLHLKSYLSWFQRLHQGQIQRPPEKAIQMKVSRTDQTDKSYPRFYLGLVRILTCSNLSIEMKVGVRKLLISSRQAEPSSSTSNRASMGVRKSQEMHISLILGMSNILWMVWSLVNKCSLFLPQFSPAWALPSQFC